MSANLCSNCGSANAAGDVYCSKCGSKLPSTAVPTSSSGQPSSPPATTTEIRYVALGLPSGLTFGSILVLIAGVLILVGFMIFVVGTASLGSNTTLDSLKTYLEAFAAFVGVGFFLAPIGWALHQMSRHRTRG